MRILNFTVLNYKSFAESAGFAALTTGINVIIGQNNSGKTALLEAITQRVKPVPHRSIRTHPIPEARPPIRISATLTVQFEHQELLEFVADVGGGHFVLLSPDGNAQSAINLFKQAGVPNFEFQVQQRITEEGEARSGVFQRHPAAGTGIHFDLRRPDLQLRPATGGANNMLGDVVARALPNRIYLFGAERFNIGESGFADQNVLDSNAANLPMVLNRLQANPERFRQYNALVRRVLPQVRWVSVQPVGGSNLRVLVWTVDPASSRIDLAIPLNDSGTGVGQVLAILYVVVTSERPQVIAVDEPQSFLHPGAVRALLEILREHSHHQFVITTHSPVALTAADPQTILLVQADEGVSQIRTLQPSEAKELRLVLAELGVRLEDVFGFDRILWVEGKTEELCFPRIIERAGGRQSARTGIFGLVSTGDLESRHRTLAFDIYRRLSAGTVLMPPAVAFVFDKERRNDREISEIARAGGHVAFLQRRMYENYLLHPGAIATVAGSIDSFGPVTSDAVEAWLNRRKWVPDLFRPRPVPEAQTDDVWLSSVSGAAVLNRLFADLSEARVVYDKVRHGVALTDWLLSNQPEELIALGQFLIALLPNDGPVQPDQAAAP